jgi:hypothetical protein
MSCESRQQWSTKKPDAFVTPGFGMIDSSVTKVSQTQWMCQHRCRDGRDGMDGGNSSGCQVGGDRFVLHRIGAN